MAKQRYDQYKAASKTQGASQTPRTRLQIMLRTSAIECDDRVRKEANYLSSKYLVHLSVLELTKNKKAKGTCWGNTTYHSFSSILYRILKNQSLHAYLYPIHYLSVIEFYWLCLIDYMRWRGRVIWLHNFDAIGLVLFFSLLRRLGLVKRIVWDLHELPRNKSLKNKWRRWVMSRAIACCDDIIVASAKRKKLLQKLGLIHDKTYCIENYPDLAFIKKAQMPLPPSVAKWLKDSPYYLAQGGCSDERRYPESLLRAFANSQRKLIVIGGYNHHFVTLLAREMPDLQQYIHFTGVIPQEKIIPYIDHAMASVIFYSQKTLNGKYCAPNRLFQALSRGTPVIVGNNPPMKKIVTSYNCGVQLPSDGRDIVSITSGIQTFEKNQKQYLLGAQTVKERQVFNFDIYRQLKVLD